MPNEILAARKGPVLEITLNRPQIGNAASDAMAVELAKLLLGAGESAEIVVLRGAGVTMLDGVRAQYRPPALILIPARTVHGFQFEPGTTGHVVSISEQMLRDLVQREPDVATLFARPQVLELPGAELRATDLALSVRMLARRRQLPERTDSSSSSTLRPISSRRRSRSSSTSGSCSSMGASSNLMKSSMWSLTILAAYPSASSGRTLPSVEISRINRS